MRKANSQQDLIIGMTLAELFLLALLVGWLGSRDEITSLEVGRAEIEATLKEQAAQLKIAQQERDEWEKKYQELLRSSGYIDPRTGELLRFGEKPKCNVANNVLIVASVRQGSSSVRMLKAFGSYGVGEVLGDQDLRRFIREVRQDSDSRKIVDAQPGCRWQYQLEWETDTDYRLGRELFEEAFYVKQLSRVGPPAR